MIVTDNKELAEKMRVLRDHGQRPERRYYHEVVGFNYRITNLQAAIGLAQLERIEKFVSRKREIAITYNRLLGKIPGIILPPEKPLAKNVYWMYSILIEKPYQKTRDQMMAILAEKGIETRPFFYPLNVLPPYKQKGNFSNSSYLSLHGLNLPSSVGLTDSQTKIIAKIFRSFSK